MLLGYLVPGMLGILEIRTFFVGVCVGCLSNVLFELRRYYLVVEAFVVSLSSVSVLGVVLRM
jgi:hypothetical protein